jgi:hypothetical protein
VLQSFSIYQSVQYNLLFLSYLLVETGSFALIKGFPHLGHLSELHVTLSGFGTLCVVHVGQIHATCSFTFRGLRSLIGRILLLIENTSVDLIEYKGAYSLGLLFEPKSYSFLDSFAQSHSLLHCLDSQFNVEIVVNNYG